MQSFFISSILSLLTDHTLSLSLAVWGQHHPRWAKCLSLLGDKLERVSVAEPISPYLLLILGLLISGSPHFCVKSEVQK